MSLSIPQLLDMSKLKLNEEVVNLAPELREYRPPWGLPMLIPIAASGLVEHIEDRLYFGVGLGHCRSLCLIDWFDIHGQGRMAILTQEPKKDTYV